VGNITGGIQICIANGTQCTCYKVLLPLQNEINFRDKQQPRPLHIDVSFIQFLPRDIVVGC
jgi:hypothetical protein